ncbi:MAG: hypothetical protein HQL31_13500, partial [Planctomycetes bacterium]|nr:hypothetical protein [Planctomycetota bacterium]
MLQPLRHLFLILALLIAGTGRIAADINFLGGNIEILYSGPQLINTDGVGLAEIAISQDGKLGIGTLAPSANLHVAGTSLLEEYLLFGAVSAAPSA